MSTTAPSHHRKLGRVASTWGMGAEPQADNGLSRERIVAAAVNIADRNGLTAVSIRKVAAQLGSSAMSLYHYIPSKRDLTNLMLDSTNAEFEFPAETITDWRGALSHFAWENRRCLNRHPWVSQLRTDNPEYGPECIRTLELLLASLARVGLDVRTSIRILGAVFIFVTGFVAEEAAEHGRRRPSSGKHPEFSKTVLATGRFPNVAQFVEMRAETPDQLFERALNWMLDGIAADLERRAGVPETVIADQTN
jgi:AcrR family transcriptional regulator